MRRILTLLLLPLAAAGTYVLRLFQCSGTPDGMPAFFLNLWGILLWGLFAAVALLLLFLPPHVNRQGDFRAAVGTAAGLPFQWAGAGLMLFSGAYGAYVSLPAVQTLPFLTSAATCLGALLLLPAVTVVLHRRQTLLRVTLLLASFTFAFRLFGIVWVLLRTETVFPGEAYALFLALLLLSLISLTALSFGDRAERRLLFFSACTFVTAGAAFCGVKDFSVAAFLIGGAVFAFGCFLSVLFADPAAKRHAVSPEPFSFPADAPSKDNTVFDLGRVDRLFREAERQGRR